MIKELAILGAGAWAGHYAYSNFVSGKVGGGNKWIEIGLMVACMGAGAYYAKKLI